MDQQKEEQVNRGQKKKFLIVALITVAIVSAVIVGTTVYQQNRNEEKYQTAITAKENGNYETAITLFQELGDYKDSTNMLQAIYDAQADAQKLEYLQTTYDAINTVWKLDNELSSIVSTIIKNVDTLNSINGDSLLDKSSYLISASHKDAISNLYSGKAYSAYRSCSYYEAARIIAAVGSAAEVRQGSTWYNVYVPIHTDQTALAFVDALKSADSLMSSLGKEIANTGTPTVKYQDLQNQILAAYESLKSYHSLVSNKPTDYDNYNTLTREKKNTVSDLLTAIKQLEPSITQK